MGWLSKLFSALGTIKQLLTIGKDVWARLKAWWVNRQVEKAKESVDETVNTGDQRKEEATIGSGSGVPHIDTSGDLHERPVKDRSK